MQSIVEKKRKEQELLRESVRTLYQGIADEVGMEPYGLETAVYRTVHDLLSYYGIKDLEVPENLPEDKVLPYVLKRENLLMRKIRLEGEWWRHAGLPVLVSYEEGEEQILLPDASGYYVRMESGKPVRIQKQEAHAIGEDAFCFYRCLPVDTTGFAGFLRFLLERIKAADIWQIVLVSVLMELCGLLMPYINSLVYNTVIPSGTARQIPGILIIVISSAFFTALIGLSRNISVARIGQKMQVEGQSAVWNRLFALPVTFFKNYDAGEIYSRANAVTQICQIVGGQLIPALLGTLLSVIYIFQLSWFAKPLVLPSLAILAVLLAHVLVSGALQVKYNRKCIEEGSRGTSILYQLLGGIVQIRTAGAEVRAYRQWAKVRKDMPVMPGYVLRMSGVVGTLLPFAGSIVLYQLAWRNGLSASDFIAFSTAFGSFQAAILSLSAVGFQIGALRVYADMLRPILEERPELYGDREEITHIGGAIELNNVFFRYREDMPYVINGMNLHIRKGEYVGVVGNSGCGKSTLFRLLLGFETAESGSVYYDGKDITRMDLQSLRRRIGVVLQSGNLFSGDIITNLSICAPMLTMEEAWNAVERAGLREDIEKMPMGMFTMLSEDGGGISGGQKQRLLIARALAANPDILLFDEATSALDNKTQSIVVQSLKALSCTRLVIAHRLSTIRDCDRILFLDKGRVAEEGTYEELMAKNGHFAEMAKRQLTE